jgi:secondary thiamine-phosphate synthase enzyme
MAIADNDTSIRQGSMKPLGTLFVLAESPHIRTEALHFATSEREQVLDLTDYMRDVVERSRVWHGQATAYTLHTTTTLAISESETGFLNDLRGRLDLLIPKTVEPGEYYEHDDLSVRSENLQEDELKNGHSHVRQMFVGNTSVTIPVVDGKILLGCWQRLLFLELDQGRDRRVILHTQG